MPCPPPTAPSPPRREGVFYIRNWTSSGGRSRLQSYDGSRRARYALRSSQTSTGENGSACGVRLTKNGETLRREKTTESFLQRCSDATRTRSDFGNRRHSSDYFQKGK